MEELETPLRWNEEPASIGSNEQKIEANRARIEELKAERETLLAKKRMQELAANRAREGDFTLAQSIMSNEMSERLQREANRADMQKMARQDLEEAKEENYLYKVELEDIDRQLKGVLEKGERRDIKAKKKVKLEQYKRFLKKNPELDPLYVDTGVDGPEKGLSVENFKERWTSVKQDLDKESKASFLAELYAYRDENGDVPGLNQLIQEVENEKTKEEKADVERSAKDNANRAIDKAVEGLDSYSKGVIRKESKGASSVIIGGKTYTVDFSVDSQDRIVAKCNGVTRVLE